MPIVTYYNSIAEVESLVIEFETKTLPRENWTHQAHLTVALWYLVHLPKTEVLEKIRRNIQAYNVASGVENTPTRGYHETLTRFWLWIVEQFLSERDKSLSIYLLSNELLNSIYADRKLPLKYYTEALLTSSEARANWIKPDLKALNRIY